MLRRSTIKRRTKPRITHPERIQHKRSRRRIADPPNAAEQRHMDRLGQMPCLGCGTDGVELHHSLTAPGKRCRRDHRFCVPLCPECHRGPQGVHGISERKFGQRIGIDLGLWAVREWERSCDLPHRP